MRNPGANSTGLSSGLSASVSAKATGDFFSKAQQRHGLKVVGSWHSLNLHHMKIDSAAGKTVEETVANLKAMAEVEYAEPNYYVEQASFDNLRSAAYSFEQLLSLNGQSYSLATVMTAAAIQAQPQTSPWPSVAANDPRITVAVIDTGLDLSHPSFSQSIWVNPGEIPANGLDDDHNGYIDDVNGWNFVSNNNRPQDDEGHGTHVSGIVLGVGQNIFATPSGPTHIRIMPLKFLDSSGSGVTSDAIKAIYYAANNGAKVANNSWGGGPYSQALAEAIAYAYGKDVLFVAAAGNSTNNNDASPNYPANYDMPNVIAVAATDDTDVIANFSNFGVQSVALSSPGVSILSTYPGNSSSPSNYAYMSGTSMASPFVAGTAALMRYQSQSMNSYQVKQLLLSSTDKKINLANYVNTSGRLNVLSAVNLATTTSVNPYKPNYVLQANPADRGLASNMAMQGGGCGLVADLSKGFWRNTTDSGSITKQIIVTLGLLLLPFMLVVTLRKPEKGASRRKYQRYSLNSTVSFKIGDQELIGAVKTISLGGSELNTEALLEQGSIITMSISSPDGKSKIDVQGHVVWSEQHKRYGVAFNEVADTIKAQITQWSQSLTKV